MGRDSLESASRHGSYCPLNCTASLWPWVVLQPRALGEAAFLAGFKILFKTVTVFFNSQIGSVQAQNDRLCDIFPGGRKNTALVSRQFNSNKQQTNTYPAAASALTLPLLGSFALAIMKQVLKQAEFVLPDGSFCTLNKNS